MTEKDKDKRKRLRVPFETQINVISQEGDALETHSKNICMNGAYVQTPKKLKENTPCSVEIMINAKNSSLVLYIDGRVSRIDNEGMGIEFHADMEWWALFCIYEQYGRPVKSASETLSAEFQNPHGQIAAAG